MVFLALTPSLLAAGHMDWDPTVVNPPLYKLENPHPFEDGLMAPSDNASPNYPVRIGETNNNNLATPYWLQARGRAQRFERPMGASRRMVTGGGGGNNNNGGGNNDNSPTPTGKSVRRMGRLSAALSDYESQLASLQQEEAQMARDTQGWHRAVERVEQQ
jgi:hypothetical protein